MILKHNYYYFKKAVPPKTCQKILKAGRKKLTRQGSLYGEKMNKKARDCKIAWIEEPWIYDILNPFIHTANRKAGWNFQWDWNEPSQFTIYKKGQYYGWHADQFISPLKHQSKNIDGKTRKLSLTLQLTEKTKYEGGDFQFQWLKQHENFLRTETVKDAKELGTIIIFPSFIWHRVQPITKGKRESLVNWSIGHPFR
tara:strand:+ start:81 stop:671 length:591 start_codon:yes stop_codon:yes gene_type:complete